MGPKLEDGNTHAPHDLKAWREGMGFSVEEACDRLEIPQGIYQAWENGKQPAPRYVTLACAALALGIKPK